MSDHKPVSSTLRIGVNLVNFDIRNDIVTETLKKFDKAENAARPVISIEPLELTSSGLVLHEQDVYTTISHNSILSGQQAGSRIVEWEAIISDPNIKVVPDRESLPAGGSQRVKLSTTLGVPGSSDTNSKSPLQSVVVVHIKRRPGHIC
ncbi:putative type II inositol 1,4,5-trisphosphate 5-phosphatase [Sugiyamaella lignohabitans]|uniref:Putative type II inositol 1,4,5-trisphosphate 5-phosphatase n=1 Tax=Sugiyamaella lignohabitans TaxID=796027 RepID=A0A167ELG2_9ASCO|nr:putative type II inositol 1,4,5-trisphosphate 5-phosphatase [Sugiyamaella lignohabitans]ANB14215.1 putative type II inositol 1,4,5-trisphosphate 5-phosphatase [Sugiyamaella lignohabitans]